MATVVDRSGNNPTLDHASGSLLNNFDGAGNSPGVPWPGGRGTLTVTGTFGGTTARLQYLAADGVTWLDADTTNASFSANGMCGFELGAGMIRINLNGGTPSAMYAKVSPIKRT